MAPPVAQQGLIDQSDSLKCMRGLNDHMSHFLVSWEAVGVPLDRESAFVLCN